MLLKINHIPIASDNKENGALLKEHLSFLRIRLRNILFEYI